MQFKNMDLKTKIIISIIILIAAGFAITGYLAYNYQPDSLLDSYYQALKEGKYGDIYLLLSEESQEEATGKQLVNAYEEFYDNSGLTIDEIDKLEEKQSSVFEKSLEYRIHFKSPYFSDKKENFTLNLVRADIFRWEIEWNYDLVFPGYQPGNEVTLERHLPVRGQLFASKGEALAQDGTAVIVGVKPSGVEDREELTDKLEQLLGVDPDWVVAKYTAPGVKPHWLVPIKTLSEKRYQKLEPQLRPIPGIFFRRIETRIYPQDNIASHIIGYTGEITARQIENYSQQDYRPGDTAGRSGLEQVLETQLRGEPGYTLKINVDGEDAADAGMVIYERPSIKGDDIYLTLDLDIQKAAKEALQQKRGAIVALTPETGEVLAVVSNPSYNPNKFSLGLTQAEWNQLQNSPGQPLYNRALKGLYPPGSTFKIITAAAALDTGTVSLETEFEDDGNYHVRGNIVRNYQREVFDTHTFKEALIHSINTTLAKTGVELGADNIKKYASRFGFGEKVEIPLTVNASSIGHPETSSVNLAWTAIGQAEVVVTPLQLAWTTAAIAAGGNRADPYMMARRINYTMIGKEMYEAEIEAPQQIIKEETAARLQEALIDVVREGTGHKAQLPGITLAGKTGTAEIGGSDSTHAWFTGFLPAEKPEIAFAVFIENGGVGGEDAAPVAREFLMNVYGLSETQQQGE